MSLAQARLLTDAQCEDLKARIARTNLYSAPGSMHRWGTSAEINKEWQTLPKPVTVFRYGSEAVMTAAETAELMERVKGHVYSMFQLDASQPLEMYFGTNFVYKVRARLPKVTTRTHTLGELLFFCCRTR
jgi:hypothetical protein